MTFMTAPASALPNRSDSDRMIEIWAANLDVKDVSLAPFMPARIEHIATDPARAERLRELIARAQGRGAGIIL